MPIRTYDRRDEIGGPDRWGVSTELAGRMQELSAMSPPLFANGEILFDFKRLSDVA